MALLSELVATCEDQRLDTGPTLGVFARRLREAGRLSKAGRGRGAAHMTYVDAARFLIACAATDHPERAADAEFVFSNMVLGNDGQHGEGFELKPAEAPTLDLALAKTLEALASGQIDTIAEANFKDRNPNLPAHLHRSFSAHVWLQLPRGGAAVSLRVLGGKYFYYHPSMAAVIESVTNGGGYPAQKIASEAFERETNRFRTGKNLTAELDGSLLRAVAKLIDRDHRRATAHD